MPGKKWIDRVSPIQPFWQDFVSKYFELADKHHICAGER
jgi:hypothetical protein